MYPSLLARDSPDARTTPRSHHASTTPCSHHTTPHAHTTLVHHLLHTTLSLHHISTWNCSRTDKMIPTYMELLTDRTYCTYIHTYKQTGGPTIHHRSSRERNPWTSRERLLARLLERDFSQDTPRERLLGAGGEHNNQPQ